MAETTPANTKVSSLNSYLPPAWESTFIAYLVLPGLCAFFLFLFIFLVAFKLIKTRKHGCTEDHSYNQRSYIEQSSDTCIYEVINDGLRTQMLPNRLDNGYEKAYSTNLQVCLPALHDPPESKTNVITTSRPQLDIPYVLHTHKGQGGGQYYDIAGLVSLLDEDTTFPVIDSDNNHLCEPDGSNPVLSTNGEFRSSTPQLHRNPHLEEYPIYESLDKSWKMNSLNSEMKLNENVKPLNGSCCYDSRFNAMDKFVNAPSAGCQSHERFLQNMPKCSKDSHEKVTGSNKEKIVYDDCKAFQLCSVNDRQFKMLMSADDPDYNHFDDDRIRTRPGRAICKLSIVIGGDKQEDDESKPTVRHYYYQMKNEDVGAFCQDDQSAWADKLNNSHIVLTPDNQDTLERHEKQIPLKLELLNTSAPIKDHNYLKNNDNFLQTKPTPGDYSEPKLRGNESKKLPPNQNNRKKYEIKKSHSFKESGKYKKTGRGRKFSLGTLSSSGAQNKIYKEVEHHHRSFDQLEVERSLAKLGPLPPTPIQPHSPPITALSLPSAPMPLSYPPPKSAPPLLAPTASQFVYPTFEQLPTSEERVEDKTHHFKPKSLASNITPNKSLAYHQQSHKEGDINSHETMQNDVRVSDTINCGSVTVPNADSLDMNTEGEKSSVDPMNSIAGDGDTAGIRGIHTNNEIREKEVIDDKASHYFILENRKHCLSENSDNEDGDSMDKDKTLLVTTDVTKRGDTVLVPNVI